MTKSAIAICGQIRGDEETWNSIIKFLQIPNSADIFVHSWIYVPNKIYVKDKDAFFYNQEEEPTCDLVNIKRPFLYRSRLIDFLNVVNPKKVLLEEQKVFDNSYFNEKHNVPFREASYYQMVRSQSYSRKKSIQLILDYELENNIQYDYIYQIRNDVCLNNILTCNEKKLFLHKVYLEAMDSLFFGDRDSMIVLSNFHDYAENMYKTDSENFRRNEYYMTKYINEKNIKYDVFNNYTDKAKYGDRGIKYDPSAL